MKEYVIRQKITYFVSLFFRSLSTTCYISLYISFSFIPRNILEHVFEALSILEQYYICSASTEIKKKKRTLYSVLCTWNEYGGRKLKLFPLKTAISSLENL